MFLSLLDVNHKQADQGCDKVLALIVFQDLKVGACYCDCVLYGVVGLDYDLQAVAGGRGDVVF